MTLWNKVLSGFDAEDETVNFGTRTVAESYDSVYETTTLATIQADGEVAENPKVAASIQGSTLCVTIDKSITIFADKSCQEIKLCIGFDSAITSHFISKDSCFLYVALDNGMLYCLNLEAGGRMIFSRNVIQGYNNGDEIVIRIFSQDADLLLVTTKGNIHKVSGFNGKLMEAVLDEEDSDVLEELTKDIECRVIFTKHPTKDVIFAEVNLFCKNPFVIMNGKDTYVWPSQEHCTLEHSAFQYTKVQYFKNNRFFICLRTDGALDIVCSATLLANKIWDGPVSDLVIVEDEVDAATEILVLLKPEQGSSTTFIQLVSFPDFEVKFNLKVSATTYLVNSDGGLIDEIVFLEGTGNSSAAIDTVKVKAVEENSPDIRLQRLLRRGKYQEAEVFAKRYNLSTDKIYSSKAASIVKEFSYFSASDKDVGKILDELIDTLDKIKDIDCVFEYCRKIVIPNFEQNRRLVSYARARLMKNAEQTNDELIATHLLNLNSTLLRIETYEVVRRIEKNTLTSNADDVNNWIEFSKSDLLTECRNHLMLGELNVAALIWVRHSSSLLPRINTEVLSDILQVIPEGILEADLWPWLFYFVPTLLSAFPDGLSEIVTWGYKRAKSFEKFDQKNWPESGLNFCRSLMNLLNFEESQSFFHLQQQYTTLHSPLQHLTAIIQVLTDLLYLKKNYKLIVKIDAYMGAPLEVVNLLLQKIYPQKVSDFVANFLNQYMLNHSLKNDDVLIYYIQKTLKSSEGWWSWQEAPWEQKIAGVIGCIQNVENRLRQTLDTLKKASVPWSPTIIDLVESSITAKHSLVTAIIAERNTVATKLILKKYGYRHIGITDILIKYIVKQDRDEMLKDLYELTKSNNQLKTRALSICINFSLNKGDLERTMSLIKGLTDEDAIYCCKEIINYIGVSLRLKEMNNTADYYIEVLGVVRTKLQSILESRSDIEKSICDDSLTTASELISLCLLRKEFGINLHPMEYQTESENILGKHLQNLCNELNDKRLSTFSTYKKAGRIAYLLGLPKILAICFLIRNTRNTEILKYYIEGINETGSFPADECPYIKRLCRIFIFDLKNEESLALSNFKNMSASALDNCSIGELSQILLTTVWTHLSCKITANEALTTVNLMNDTTKWRLYKIYTDTDMCSGQMILPFLIQSFKFHSFCTDKELIQENSSTQLTNLITRIKEIPIESYDFSFLKILSTLVSSCASTNHLNDQIISELQSIRDTCLCTLLKKIISARTFDLQCGLACLFMLPERDAFKWLKSACKIYETNYSRLRAVSDLGYEYCYSIKNAAFLSYFSYHRVCLYWAQRLQSYGIHHKEILTSNTEGKQQILERLMRCEKSGFIQLLKEFCIDFEFDFDECYILYLDILLKQWNPAIKIVTLNGKKELKINELEVIALHRTCKQVAALIEDKSAMRKHLATLWSKINFYHYEVFLLVMELLEDKNQMRLNHFCFLQNYVRFGSPTQIEYEEWAQLCPENNSLPEISKWRLPFLPKVDQWKLIEPELNLSTYEKWMEVAQILNLQVHLICTFAIKGSVKEVWQSMGESKKSQPEWLIHSKNSALLEDIKACIKHMPDQDALYYGTAVLYYVVNHTPPGADQAAAAQECYAYAQKWAQASVKSDDVMIEKTKYKYLQLTAKHILHTHGLGNDHYLQLVPSPERLAHELYMDESIVKRSRGATEHRPDINSAVHSLGKIFSLNLIQLRLELLEEWLQPSDSSCKLDDSMTFNIAASSAGTDDHAVDDDNLLRACYILEWGDKVMSANYLINMAFGLNNEASFRPGIQFRALQVLLSIIDPETVQDLTKRDLKSIKQHMKSLQYVSELERIGLTFSVHRFESSSKLELAQALSRSHGHLPEALVLILQICIDFGLKNYNLWDETLSTMAKMCMVKELGKFLPKVSTATYAVGCNGYIKGWEVLIWEPFRRSDALLSQHQFKDCLMSICLLHSCPVARKLNLKSIVHICFQSHHPELAAALLPFLNKSDTDFVLETLKTSFVVSKVIEELRGLSTEQILTISYSIKILEEFFELDLVKNGGEFNVCR